LVHGAGFEPATLSPDRELLFLDPSAAPYPRVDAVSRSF